MRETSLPPAKDRGAILVHAAFALLAVTAFTTFVVDHGVYYLARREIQNAADAGALAAASAIFYDSATLAAAKDHAVTIARKNLVYGQEPSVGETDVTFPACPPNAPSAGTCVRVDAYRSLARANPLPMFFGPLVGLTSQDVQATAMALAPTGPPPPDTVMLVR
jgi:Flp pilus assembly protein TadG